jgi:hypothetical protein
LLYSFCFQTSLQSLLLGKGTIIFVKEGVRLF